MSGTFVCILRGFAPQTSLRFSPIHQLPEAEFIEQLASRYGAIPAPILVEPELMKLFLPVLRADIEILETYVYKAAEPLNVGISVFGGASDTNVDKSGLDAWAEQTSASMAVRIFPGDHFFPRVAREDLLKSISSDLAECLRKYPEC